MPYSNGVFHIDLVSGSDAARTALTGCVASNPAGTTTRINKTAHGLVTGAVVDTTLFTSWLNGAWKITVVDADNFDLDDAVWQTTADPNGTVTPRGGASWADAWLTISSGATALRIQPGDKFKISKTADPVSFGIDATWTNTSKAVTLASALSKKVEDAVNGWTASANITAVGNTNRKLGPTALQITPALAFTTGKVAFKTIAGGGTQDFSAYTHINFWIRPVTAAAIAANTYRISLCSDANGDTTVSAFNIPAIPANVAWYPMSIALGGAMSANVQSVSISAIVDPGTTAISINNIFASTGGLSLLNLIGKNNEVYYAIQSVDNLTVNIDANSTTAAGQGYSGATSTETLYYRVPLTIENSGTYATMQEAGTSAIQKNHYEGGWNTGTDTLDGLTVLANSITATGVPISFLSYNKLSNFVFSRFSAIAIVANFLELENIVFTSCVNAISDTNQRADFYFKNVKFLNLSGTPSFNGTVTLENCEFRNNTFNGTNLYGGNKLINCTFANNASPAINFEFSGRYGDGAVLLRNCLIDQANEFASTNTRTGFIWSFDHDNTSGNHWGFTWGATINWQTAVKNTGAVGSWMVAVTSNIRNSYQPVYFKLAEVAVAAGSLVTVKVWVKKDHATNGAAAIYVEDAAYNIAGVAASMATKADDTNWEELTLTFTPTEAGIVPIFAEAWHVASSSLAYFGPLTVTQA